MLPANGEGEILAQKILILSRIGTLLAAPAGCDYNSAPAFRVEIER